MRSVAAALIVLSLAVPAAAQQGAAPSNGGPANGSSAIDVDRLPINLSRIQRELKQAQDVEERDGLNLRYRISVIGVAPPIDLFTDEVDLVNGPVPYGAPTHQEIINHITPLPFRSPVMDFSALMRWLADRDKKKDGKQ
jgi:hypothetical protein